MTAQNPALAELQRFLDIRKRQSLGGKKSWKGLTKSERSARAKANRAHGRQKGDK